jgi:hypothetical protein
MYILQEHSLSATHPKVQMMEENVKMKHFILELY